MRLLRTILTTLAVSTAIAAYSLPENHFAKKSVLADGKWVRVAVDATGMYQISDSELRAMGFANPQKVRVYGKGGRALPEGLHVLMPDDLPQLPSVRTAKGIVFYATDCNTWAAARSGNAPYTHAINPYFSDASYYFLSDSDAPEVTLPQMKAADGVEDVITTFYARLVHEQEASRDARCSARTSARRSRASLTSTSWTTQAAGPASKSLSRPIVAATPPSSSPPTAPAFPPPPPTRWAFPEARCPIADS